MFFFEKYGEVWQWYDGFLMVAQWILKVVLRTLAIWEDNKFKLKKWFTILKNKKHFTKIRKDFFGKPKIFLISPWFLISHTKYQN